MIFPSCMPGGINMVRQALGGFIDPPTISCLFHQVFSVPNCYISKDIRLHKLPINDIRYYYKQKKKNVPIKNKTLNIWHLCMYE